MWTPTSCYMAHPRTVINITGVPSLVNTLIWALIDQFLQC